MWAGWYVTPTGQIVQKRLETEPESSKAVEDLEEQYRPSTCGGHGFGHLKLVAHWATASNVKSNYLRGSCTLLHVSMFFMGS